MSPGEAHTTVRGAPQRMRAWLAPENWPEGATQVQVLGSKGQAIGAPVAIRSGRRAGGGLRRLRFRLDRHLPPGHYAAELRGATLSRRIALEVEPCIALRPDPPALVVEAARGGRVSAELVLANRGNVDFDVPARAVLGVYDDDGLETAIARAYRGQGRDGLAMLGSFIEDLQRGHGGLLRLRIVDGAGALAPGEARRVALASRLPPTLAARHAYTGFWSLGNLDYTVQVRVRARPPAKPRRRSAS